MEKSSYRPILNSLLHVPTYITWNEEPWGSEIDPVISGVTDNGVAGVVKCTLYVPRWSIMTDEGYPLNFGWYANCPLKEIRVQLHRSFNKGSSCLFRVISRYWIFYVLFVRKDIYTLCIFFPFWIFASRTNCNRKKKKKIYKHWPAEGKSFVISPFSVY